MTSPLTPERKQGIRERIAAATKGPCIVEPINDGETYQVTTAEDTGFAVVCETPNMDDPADATFIAHAYSDLPDLYESHEALTKALRDCADDLEAEIYQRITPEMRQYPCMHADYDRDMATVRAARLAYRNAGGEE